MLETIMCSNSQRRLSHSTALAAAAHLEEGRRLRRLPSRHKQSGVVKRQVPAARDTGEGGRGGGEGVSVGVCSWILQKVCAESDTRCEGTAELLHRGRREEVGVFVWCR